MALQGFMAALLNWEPFSLVTHEEIVFSIAFT